MSRTTFASLMIVLALFGAISFYGFPDPTEPIGSANGTYVNACCGSLELRNGLMTLKEGPRLKYVVERDKRRYVLPEVYVGASAGGFVVERNGRPLKLPMDGESPPLRLDLMQKGSGKVFSFERIDHR